MALSRPRFAVAAIVVSGSAVRLLYSRPLVPVCDARSVLHDGMIIRVIRVWSTRIDTSPVLSTVGGLVWHAGQGMHACSRVPCWETPLQS